MPRNLIYVAFYLLLSKRTHFSTSVNSQIDWTTGLVYLNAYLSRQALYSLGITVEHPYVNFYPDVVSTLGQVFAQIQMTHCPSTSVPSRLNDQTHKEPQLIPRFTCQRP